MVDRGLLYREWKQNQVVILLSIVFLVLANPLSIVNTYLTYQGCLDRQDPQYCDFIVNYSISNLIDINWVPGVILAVCFLGMERSKGTMDFILSLPYNRSQIFQTKFWLGGFVIVLSQLIGFLLAWLLILVYSPEHVYYFEHSSVGVIVISFMAFSLVMAAGALTGNSFAQLLTALSAGILPYLIVALPVGNFEVVFGVSIWELFPSPESYFSLASNLSYLVPISYVVNEWLTNSKYLLLIPAVMSILFYLIGLIGFKNLPSERNGHFFLWNKLDRPVQILVIAFGILGFGLFGYYSGNSIIGYILGMIIGAVAGFFVSYLSIYKKTKH
ncbi:ABC transporter permease YtrC [Bacillus inaquosorum]|uniref:ABC transporter permease YtrC n=1 Tax=Bacillus inaquosorum TaxID=483913 RepID=UPI002281DED2|nr:ABC transporter permease YtrC [Bacillus inaquosorum]MCY7941894.1 ABC transporter permease YtrC [Bacillus inaquosorum]MCY7983479.1 ABC transporter permease YtrC [Bacillus inaquosorum]MCY8244265.1 ABC transporter permease YtrC [Bacillus inaquosorum]MCY8249105.1 ABC transporter permease YtrC [Bacillus inaquosorum]MCY8296900.1 ABC transporter permease YtrC [Bacillus inaquosorum]